MSAAIPCAATLDGLHLLRVEPKQVRERQQRDRTVGQTATLRRREVYVLPPQGSGLPLVPPKKEWAIGWANLATYREALEELISLPGVHAFSRWRPELLTWVGNGARVEFFLPPSWRLAADVFDYPPDAPAPTTFDPRVRVGAGVVLTPLIKSSVDYAAGDPAEGEVWLLEGGSQLKLEAAPAVGAYVRAWLVPVFDVFVGPEADRQFTDPLREPLDLVLLER